MAVDIVHVIGQLARGGSERQLAYVACALKKKGWSQVVVTFNPGDPLEQELRDAGIEVVGLPRNAFKVHRLQQYRRMLRRIDPSIIHSWSAHTNIYTTWATFGMRGHSIMSMRGNPALNRFKSKPLSWPARVLHRHTYESADYIVSNSAAALQSAIEMGVHCKHTALTENIIVARGRANPAEVTPRPRIAAAGGLVRNKAYDVLLRALRLVRDAGHDFEFSLAGRGPQRASLDALATELALGDRVKLLGEVPDVPALFATAHLVVHPSRSEGMSNTILEAMAEGLPVIATRVGGTPEIVSDGVNGLLVPPDSPAALAEKIILLLDDPARRGALGAQGFKLITERFSVERVVKQYADVYYALGSRPSA